MNFKGAISMIMGKMFSVISFTSFLILMCMNDVPAGYEARVVTLLVTSIVSLLLAFLFLDPSKIFKHIFALKSLVILLRSTRCSKLTMKNMYLCKLARDSSSLLDFYSRLLELY